MSWTRDLRRYLETRFPATQFIPLAAFLGTAALAPSPPTEAWRWLTVMVMALALVLQFRLWDDIADRDLDRDSHPGRVLCVTSELRAFQLTAAVLFLVNGMLLYWHHNQVTRTVAYLVFCICMLAWYRMRPRAARAGLLNSQLVLLKYPVIAWLISTPAPDTDIVISLSCLCSVYLIFSSFELVDDNTLRQRTGAGFILGAGYALLLSVWVLVALWNRPYSGPLPWLAWGIIIIATLLLGLAACSRTGHQSVTRSGRGIFIVGLLAYIAIAVESSR